MAKYTAEWLGKFSTVTNQFSELGDTQQFVVVTSEGQVVARVFLNKYQLGMNLAKEIAHLLNNRKSVIHTGRKS